VRVSDLAGVSRIFSGPNDWVTIAAKSDGSAWGWGLNDHGHLGCGTYSDAQPLCRVRGVATDAGPIPLDGIPERFREILAGYPRFLREVIDVATDVNQSCFLTTEAPVHVPSIAMVASTVNGKAAAAATVTVLDEFDAPAVDALVIGHWSGQTAGSTSGITGSDGTATLASPAIRGSGGTVTFLLDTVAKAGMFLDRQGSVLTNSITLTR
jgi:hypothetical protein